MHGPEILVRSLFHPSRTDSHGNRWQYHSRSDRHSKVACWGIVFDLLLTSPLLRRHIQEGRVGFGINHQMRDFVHDRKKNLDMVLCTPASDGRTSTADFASLVAEYEIDLSVDEQAKLAALPMLHRTPVGSVLMALEAKAAMTAHQRALPRLYDELNSSHLTVHGASEQAIAAGFVMVNIAERYLSPDLNKRAPRHRPGLEHASATPRRAAGGRQGETAAQAGEGRGHRLRRAGDRRGRGPRTMAANSALSARRRPRRAGEIYDYASMIDRTRPHLCDAVQGPLTIAAPRRRHCTPR